MRTSSFSTVSFSAGTKFSSTRKQAQSPLPQFAGADGGAGNILGAAGALGMLLSPVIKPINGAYARILKLQLERGWKSLHGDADKAAFLKNASGKGNLHRSYGALWAASKVTEIVNDQVKTLVILDLLNRFHNDAEVVESLRPGVESVTADYAGELFTAYEGGFQQRRALQERLQQQ